MRHRSQCRRSSESRASYSPRFAPSPETGSGRAERRWPVAGAEVSCRASRGRQWRDHHALPDRLMRWRRRWLFLMFLRLRMLARVMIRFQIGNDSAVLHTDHAPRVPGDVGLVRHHDDGLAFIVQLVEEAENFLAGAAVEI